MNFYLTYIPISIYIFYLLIFDKNSLFKFSVFILPWNLLTFDIGIQLTPFKILQILLLLLSIPKLTTFFVKSNLFSSYYLYILLVSTISFLYIQFTNDPYIESFSFFRGKYRILTSIFSSFLDIAYLLAAINWVSNLEQLQIILKVFLNSVFVLSILGLIQFLFFFFFGTNIFPLIREGESIDPIFTSISGILRINSLAGEPKDFASTLMVAILIIITARTLFNEVFSSFKIKVYIFLFISMLILTFSTTGFLILPLILVYKIISDLKNDRKDYLVIFFIFLFLFFLLDYSTLKDLYEIRTLGRFENSSIGFWEENNKAIIDYFSFNPFSIIFGLGQPYVHLYTYKFIPEDSFDYMYKSVYVAKSGLLRLLSEGGIFLILIFFSITYFIMFKLNQFKLKYLSNLLFLLCILFLVNVTNGNFYFYFLFIFYAFLQNSKKIIRL
jgi:hypothetical protein